MAWIIGIIYDFRSTCSNFIFYHIRNLILKCYINRIF